MQMDCNTNTAGVQPAASWRTGASADVLRALARPDVNLVTWRRQVPAQVASSLAAWARRPSMLFEREIAVARYELARATAGMAAAARRWLTVDVALLVARFARLAGADRLVLRFGVIRGDQCRKFHEDYVRYRLITTYVGPGTEWVPDEAVRREALVAPAEELAQANRAIVRDAFAIRHADAGDVLVMKGARHAHGCGAVHRSPPIEGTGRRRVTLVLSTVEGT